MAVLSVDPGLTGTGYAVWSASAELWRLSRKPTRVGVITPPAKLEAMAKLRYLVERLSGLMANEDINRVACELPEFWAGAFGRAVAARGDLVKLSLVVGAVAALAVERRAVFTTVPVRDWKGNLPKDVVERRIRRRIGDGVCEQLGIKSHAWDAVGIGLYVKGML